MKGGSHTAPAPIQRRADVLANASQTNEGPSQEAQTTPQLSFSPSALAALSRFLLPCSPVEHTAATKNHRIAPCHSAAQRSEASNPVRTMRCSASMQGAGHFFIAGRMADVCAELDRLAEYEAAH